MFRIIESLLDKQFYSHEHLENISGTKAGSKTTIKQLKGRVCNLAEDQKPVKYINTSFITRIISGEPISVEEKGTTDTFKLVATMLFSVNEVINFKETGKFITDRLVVIPFNNTFTDDNNNRIIDIGIKLCKDLPLQIIATKSIIAFLKVLNNGKFTIPDNVKQETDKYFMECNNVVEFCNLFKIKTFISKTEYYKRYDDWCHQNFYEPLNNAQFGKQVLALGYRSERFSLDDDRPWYYVNATFDRKKKDDVYQSYTLVKEKNSSFQDYLWKQIEAEQKTEDEQTIGNEQNTQEAQSTENEETASDNT